MSRAIITGCALQMSGGGPGFAWGDLWIDDGAPPRFIFHAVINRSETAVWSPTPPDASRKAIAYNSQRSFFERRGVYVLDYDHCVFNPLALLHLQEWEPSLYARLQADGKAPQS